MATNKKKIKDAIYTRRYVYNLHYHLIWCTKYRNPTFTTNELQQEMKDILLDIANNNDINIEKMEVMPDHVHLLVNFPPRLSITNVIATLKGRSAFIFFHKHPEIKKNKYWGGHLWPASYYVGSLGNMSKDVVEKYIQNQKYNALHKRQRGERVGQTLRKKIQ